MFIVDGRSSINSHSSPNHITKYIPFMHFSYIISVYIICYHASDKRNFMARAHTRGMTSSEFVYFYYSLIPEDDEYIPWDLPDGNFPDSSIPEIKQAFTHFKQV